MTKSPVDVAMVAAGLKALELALLAELDVAVVNQVRNGAYNGVHPRILAVLEKFGYDPVKLASEQKAWRAQRAKELLATKLAANQ